MGYRYKRADDNKFFLGDSITEQVDKIEDNVVNYINSRIPKKQSSVVPQSEKTKNIIIVALLVVILILLLYKFKKGK